MIKDAYLKSMITVMGILSPDITIFILVMSCIWLGYPLNTELLFYIINCVRSIRVLITFILPRSIGMTADMLGCIKRINRLLHAQELPTRHDQFSDNPKVLLKNVNVQVDNKLLLSRVSLIIRPGLTTIIGTLPPIFPLLNTYLDINYFRPKWIGKVHIVTDNITGIFSYRKHCNERKNIVRQPKSLALPGDHQRQHPI